MGLYCISQPGAARQDERGGKYHFGMDPSQLWAQILLSYHAKEPITKFQDKVAKLDTNCCKMIPFLTIISL